MKESHGQPSRIDGGAAQQRHAPVFGVSGSIGVLVVEQRAVTVAQQRLVQLHGSGSGGGNERAVGGGCSYVDSDGSCTRSAACVAMEGHTHAFVAAPYHVR
jgi:hypothetical protein